MRIGRYGIVLKKLERKHLELLRQWRNDPKISRHMFQQARITPAMQLRWFNTINNPQNFFFIIHVKNKPVGLINLSSVDYEKKTAFSGLFIYDDDCVGTDVPVRASLTLLDVFFLLFGIETVFAKVRSDNPVAHRYNTALGFVRSKKIEMGLGYECVLHKPAYLQVTAPLRNMAASLYGNTTLIHLRKNKHETEIRNQMRCTEDTATELNLQLI